MIAMQYGFELPADYDMAIIERRVRAKGHLFDDTPGLGVKAFLSARRGDPQTGSQVNVYAPFYVWTEPQAMVDFLCDARFVGLTSSFGWPSIQPWSVFDVRACGVLTDARFATRMVEAIYPFESLSSTREAERSATDAALQGGALLAISGFDVKIWQRARFCLWRDEVSAWDPHTTVYNVLHTSAPHGTQPFVQ